MNGSQEDRNFNKSKQRVNLRKMRDLWIILFDNYRSTK